MISIDGSQCYKCKNYGHITTICPTKEKKLIHVFEFEYKVTLESTNKDQEVVKEVIHEIKEERVQATNLPICVVYQMLFSQTNSMIQVKEDLRRNNIFHMRDAHKGKTINVIIDNRSGLNVIFIKNGGKTEVIKGKTPYPIQC